MTCKCKVSDDGKLRINYVLSIDSFEGHVIQVALAEYAARRKRTDFDERTCAGKIAKQMREAYVEGMAEGERNNFGNK